MTDLVFSSVTNNHEYSAFRRAVVMLRTWQQRARTRRELARWGERELHDIGLSWSAIADEVNKPFWRA